jgi:hypothetical protein
MAGIVRRPPLLSIEKLSGLQVGNARSVAEVSNGRGCMKTQTRTFGTDKRTGEILSVTGLAVAVSTT